MVSELRIWVEKMGRSQNILYRAAFRWIKAMGALRRFLLSSRIRSQILTRRQYAGQHFQGETFTCEDRYPELFDECRERLANRPGARILSYGCATGEEVFTLARYLPQAEIVGVDINRWCLKECARRNTRARTRFLHRMSPEFVSAGEFDAVFCMAVFQRTEHRTAGAAPVETGFTFGRFEDEVRMLDEKLKPGGLLFLDECDFSFEQTAVAARYRPLEFVGNRVLRRRPLFGSDNRLIASQHESVRGFVKLCSE